MYYPSLRFTLLYFSMSIASDNFWFFGAL